MDVLFNDNMEDFCRALKIARVRKEYVKRGSTVYIYGCLPRLGELAWDGGSYSAEFVRPLYAPQTRLLSLVVAVELQYQYNREYFHVQRALLASHSAARKLELLS